MKDKKNLIGLILVILSLILFLVIVLILNNKIDINILKANINDMNSISSYNKYYSLYDEVYFNPVNYTWCDEENEDNNCFSWYVLNHLGDKVELIYKKDKYVVSNETGSGTTTVVDDINNITSTWSDNLKITNSKYKTISSSYPAPIEEYPTKTIDFSNSKARLPFGSEISDALIKNFKNSSICGVSGYPCISIYDIEGEETEENYNKWGIINANSLTNGSMGGLQVSNPYANFYIHPIIEVEREKVRIAKKEIFNDERNYYTGLIGVVYLDPTDLTRTCTKADSDENVNSNGTPTNIKEGCMKWYIIGEQEDSYKLFLDHNTTALTAYNSNNDSSEMLEAKQVLKSDTANWQVPGRLISMYDIGEALGVQYTDDADYALFVLYRGLYNVQKSHFGYLMDYINTSYAYNDNNPYLQGDGYGTSSIEGYWTSTPQNSNKVKTVDETGSIMYVNARYVAGYGIRPLILLPKSVFYEGLSITYNDEGRITIKSARYDSKIENIDAQGKEGYLFDHWSLEENGEAFDFTTKVTSDITLYAVYKKKTFVSESYALGQLVYFDPVSDNKCDETTFDLSKIIDGTSTCYKWRVISTDDSLVKNKLNLMLDHNLINKGDWASSEELSIPDKAFSDLAQATSTWTRVDNLNYSYDTTVYESGARGNYGLLKCIDGVCTITKDGNTMEIATNVKTRLITIEEVQNMIESIDAEKVWTYTPNATYTRGLQSLAKKSIALDHQVISSFYFSYTGNFSSSIGVRGNTELAWLSENTETQYYEDTHSTDNQYGENNYGYYSLNLNPLEGRQVAVLYPGNVAYRWAATDANNPSGIGLRPVISLNKEYLSSNIEITYNDEERITTRQIEVNTTAEEIASQGKEHFTFKHWSLEKNGEAFDFDTKLTQNTTLYAVYELDKHNVEFYDGEEKLGTLKVNYGGKVLEELIPEVLKEGYKFIGWTEENTEELFDFDTVITKDYKLYSNYEELKEECILSLTSNMYDVDDEKLEISKVPEKADNAEIEKHLIIKANSYEITSTEVTIRCDDKVRVYKIKRTWLPQTGVIIIRYSKIIGYLSIIIVLLIVINKQRLLNKRLRE